MEHTEQFVHHISKELVNLMPIAQFDGETIIVDHPEQVEKAVKYLNDTFYFQDNSSGRGEDYEITTHDFDSMEDFIDSFCNYIKTGKR